MQATKQLSSAGQSIWLGNITRDLLAAKLDPDSSTNTLIRRLQRARTERASKTL